MVQAASIVGQRFSISGLRHLLEGASCDPGALMTHHLVRPDGKEFLFGHALIRDAIYATLLRGRRRELHRRAAVWFAEQGDATLHAEHLDRAEAPDAAAAYLEASRVQAALHRYETALAQVERGLVLAHDPELGSRLPVDAAISYRTSVGPATPARPTTRRWRQHGPMRNVAELGSASLQ